MKYIPSRKVDRKTYIQGYTYRFVGPIRVRDTVEIEIHPSKMLETDLDVDVWVRTGWLIPLVEEDRVIPVEEAPLPPPRPLPAPVPVEVPLSVPRTMQLQPPVAPVLEVRTLPAKPQVMERPAMAVERVEDAAPVEMLVKPVGKEDSDREAIPQVMSVPRMVSVQPSQPISPTEVVEPVKPAEDIPTVETPAVEVVADVAADKRADARKKRRIKRVTKAKE